MRRPALFALLLIAPILLWAGLPLVSSGQSGKAASVRNKIERTEGRIAGVKRKEVVLTTDITALNNRVDSLDGDINVLQARQNRIQGDLDVKRKELERLQLKLREERARLAKLRARLARSRRILSQRLVELYKAGRPDIVTVILESDGFVDLLERQEFIRRINDQDERIIRAVRTARNQSKVASDALADLESRQQKITAEILSRRNEVASVKLRLVSKQNAYASARADRAATLRSVRGHKEELIEDLESLQKEQAEIEGALQGAPGPIRRGSGNMIWPVNGPITGVFGENRGDHIHAGLDIAAPNGTPIRAADSGTVVLAGPQGGYGNYTCVAHSSSLSTCYAHQSSFATSTGANVSQGEVIGYVGNTGNSSGAHLHFEVRVNGSPVNPLSYL
ncbi:MAG: murein hydrolase activator EnvC family protein [Solirubrobacteraceae bacterium]